MLLWLITTLALAVAIPAAWTQLHVVDADGYAALARGAAADPDLQSAMAAELTTRAMALIAEHGGGRYPVDSSDVHDAASAFTAGPTFPPLFAQANRAAHGWLFGDPGGGENGDQWAVDVAPMLGDDSIRPLLSRYYVTVPAKLAVPLTVSMPQAMRQGRLSRLSTWAVADPGRRRHRHAPPHGTAPDRQDDQWSAERSAAMDILQPRRQRPTAHQHVRRGRRGSQIRQSGMTMP